MITEKDRLDELLIIINEFKTETNKKLLEIEKKNNKCENCGGIDPLSKDYFFKHLWTKKFFVNFTWRLIVKTIFIALLVIFFYDHWFPFIDKIRRFFPWNDPKPGKF